MLWNALLYGMAEIDSSTMLKLEIYARLRGKGKETTMSHTSPARSTSSKVARKQIKMFS